MNKPISDGSQARREIIRRRDKFICQMCGKVWVIGKRRFDVHHIDCKKEKSNQIDDILVEHKNMITLCHECHINIHYIKNIQKQKLVAVFINLFIEKHKNDTVLSNGEIKHR